MCVVLVLMIGFVCLCSVNIRLVFLCYVCVKCLLKLLMCLSVVCCMK